MAIIRIGPTTAVGVYRIYESDGKTSAVRVSTIIEPVAPRPSTPTRKEEAVREWETAVREVLEFEVTGDEIAHIECSKTSWELSACSCGLEAAIARLRALLPESTEGGE